MPVDGTYVGDLLPGLLLMSFGMGNYVRADHADRDHERRRPSDAGLASGLFNTSQQIGGALGLAVLSTLAADKTASVLGGLGHLPTAARAGDGAGGGLPGRVHSARRS